MGETINVKDIIQMLQKRIWLIAIITLAITSISAVVSYFLLTPIYEARTDIIVNQARDEQQFYNVNDIQTNLQLVTTYTGIIKRPVVLDKVKENLELDYTIEQLKGQIDVVNEKNSQIISIVAKSSNPKEAVEITNQVAKVFKEEVVKIMNIDNVNILSEAEMREKPAPVSPNPTLNIALAFVMGLIIGSLTALIIEHFDNTIKSEEDIEKFLNQSVLGVVSTLDKDSEKALVGHGKRKQVLRGDTVGS